MDFYGLQNTQAFLMKRPELDKNFEGQILESQETWKGVNLFDRFERAI